MRYGIGLDIGIGSVGSAVIQLDENNEPYKIEHLHVRVFEPAKDNVDRRTNKGTRRRIRRRRHRKDRVKNLIYSEFNTNEQEVQNLYTEKKLSDIYEIRYNSLERSLSKEEFIRLLIHLSQRRGFKSNRKAEKNTVDDKSEEGKVLSSIHDNQELMSAKGYRTIGEMLFLDEKFSVCKRNKAGNYSVMFTRSDYEYEIKQIFDMQRKYGNKYATDKLEDAYLNIYLSQRSFDEGPGRHTASGDAADRTVIEDMIGKCSLERKEYRSPQAAYTFEYFNLLSKINAIRIVDNGEKRALTPEERQIIKELAFRSKVVTYQSIRKALKINDTDIFNISYSESVSSNTKTKKKKEKANKDFNEIRKETEEKTKFSYLKAYHTFKKVYGDNYDNWDISKRNELAYILTVAKTDKTIIRRLASGGYTETEIEKALKIPSFSKFGHLSVKAMNKMIPYLEQGDLYNEAMVKAGYMVATEDSYRGLYLPASPDSNSDKACELEDITNPVVRRAISQTIKVVNAIIRKMNNESPVYVNVELAREFSKRADERQKIEKRNKDNQKRNEELMDEIRREFKYSNPDGQDLIKLKLWTEQQGECIYSGTVIERERLFEPGYVEIDHIVPYSISYDNSYDNKVLVKTKENQNKANRLPLQYMEGERANKFRVRVQRSTLSYRKKQRLLKESISEEELNGFRQRNLQDTQYISRFMMNYIKKYLLFADKPNVTAVNGAITSYMRKRWGIPKIRANGDIHHAIDACVVACTTQGMIQKISTYSKYKELRLENNKVDTVTGEIIDDQPNSYKHFPMPYPSFRRELEMLTSADPNAEFQKLELPNYNGDEILRPIFVSRMPNRRVTGAAHEDTIRKGLVCERQQYTVQKCALMDLKIETDKLTGEKKIENYYNPQDDRLLYTALLSRLIEYDGKAEKAFAEPFYKPKSDGSKGPLVKKVKKIEKSTRMVPLDQGGKSVATKGSMIRVDVFYVDGKGYYLVPIYVSDTVKKELPNKAITRDKPYEQWYTMAEKDFLFSLYKYDLIRITSSREIRLKSKREESTLEKEYKTKSELLYYCSTDIHTNSITCIDNCNAYEIRGLGIRNLLVIEKFSVDILGNISRVNKEKRTGF